MTSDNNPSFLPTWVKIVFKIYGALVAITGALALVNLPALIWAKQFDLLIVQISMVIVFIFMGVGSWYLKRWVIPLFLVSGGMGLISTLFYNNHIGLQQINLFIPFILFFIAYRYRSYFSGPLKHIVIQGLAISSFIILIISGILIKMNLNRVSDQAIDAFFQSEEFVNIINSSEFRDLLKSELSNKLNREVTDEEINKLFSENKTQIIEILKNSQEFRNSIRLILESQKRIESTTK